MEEFSYLRELERNPNLNENIKILRGYLSSDFYFYFAKVANINNMASQFGYKKAIKLTTEVKDEMNTRVNWQKFMSIYCEILIISYLSNTDNQKNDVKKVTDEINGLSKPVVSYLYKVYDWGVFEVILFKIFLFSFRVEQIEQLLPLAISRTQKESQLPVMSHFKMEIIYSSFSYFVNYRHEKLARNTLDLAKKLLKDEKDLNNSTLLLFYEGWYQYIFVNEKIGLESCHQAISIFKILDQPTLVKRFQGILTNIKKNKKQVDSYLTFM